VTTDNPGDTRAVSKRVILRSEHERIVKELREELDRALKRIEALRQMRDSMNGGSYDCMDWCDKTHPCPNCRTKMTIDAILSDAPTENKSNG
jgi:hypothetical protein